MRRDSSRDAKRAGLPTCDSVPARHEPFGNPGRPTWGPPSSRPNAEKDRVTVRVCPRGEPKASALDPVQTALFSTSGPDRSRRVSPQAWEPAQGPRDIVERTRLPGSVPRSDSQGARATRSRQPQARHHWQRPASLASALPRRRMHFRATAPTALASTAPQRSSSHSV